MASPSRASKLPRNTIKTRSAASRSKTRSLPANTDLGPFKDRVSFERVRQLEREACKEHDAGMLHVQAVFVRDGKLIVVAPTNKYLLEQEKISEPLVKLLRFGDDDAARRTKAVVMSLKLFEMLPEECSKVPGLRTVIVTPDRSSVGSITALTSPKFETALALVRACSGDLVKTIYVATTAPADAVTTTTVLLDALTLADECTASALRSKTKKSASAGAKRSARKPILPAKAAVDENEIKLAEVEGSRDEPSLDPAIVWTAPIATLLDCAKRASSGRTLGKDGLLSEIRLALDSDMKCVLVQARTRTGAYTTPKKYPLVSLAGYKINPAANTLALKSRDAKFVVENLSLDALDVQLWRRVFNYFGVPDLAVATVGKDDKLLLNSTQNDAKGSSCTSDSCFGGKK